MTEYKIVVVGAGGVGKSALVIQFIQEKFIEKYDPTIEDSYRKQVDIEIDGKGTAVMLDILDTAGQEEFSTLRTEYMDEGHGFIIVYSITDPHSFEETLKLYDEILEAKGTDADKIPIMLVGNKIDLQHERCVTTEEGLERAKKFGYPDSCEFLESSAKDRTNVDEIFTKLILLINKIEGVPKEQDENEPQPESDSRDEEKEPQKPQKKKFKCILL